MALALAGGGVALSAAPASAATCSGHGCDNKDANATGCASGAYSIGTQRVFDHGINIGMIEARYSPACGTRWVRTTSFMGARYILAMMYVGSGPVLIQDGVYVSAWTNMLYAPLPLRACYGGYISPISPPNWCS